MSVSPFVIGDRKATSRVAQSPVIGVNEAYPELNKFRYFRAGQAITAGQWVSLNGSSDLRSVLLAAQGAGINFGVGVAVEAATAGEATAGKLIKVQVAGFHAAASVATGGSAGHWCCLGGVAGTCLTVDPGALSILDAVHLRNLGDQMGILLEAAAGGLASVWILPRFV